MPTKERTQRIKAPKKQVAYRFPQGLIDRIHAAAVAEGLNEVDIVKSALGLYLPRLERKHGIDTKEVQNG